MVKIGFITDLHFRQAVPGTSRIAKRECRRAGDLLDRSLASFAAEAVDLVACAGDCIDDASQPSALDDVAWLRDRFAASGLRSIVIPGNHDPAPEAFYQVFPHPPARLRVGDCEVITFADDACEPGAMRCRRSEAAMHLLETALAERPDDVALTLLVQHYVVFPEHVGDGYNHTYANDAEIRAALERSPRRLLVLSGHSHGGHALQVHRGVTFFTGRALCERPYPYYVLHTGGETLQVEERTLE
jgi:3',5'-cyclic AMP phosphodiesterase CpdA